MEIKKCVCGNAPKIIKDKEVLKFSIRCPFCGKNTGFLSTEETALFNWNHGLKLQK